MTRGARVLCAVLAIAAALPELVTYAGYVRRGDYPGSAYGPRVDAVLKTAQAAIKGGPFVTVPARGGYSAAPGLINDLGTAAVVDLIARTTGRAASLTTLGALNLVVMAVAVVALVLAWPANLRLALVPVFLLAPLTTPLYRSADSIATHGPLAALSIAIAVGGLRVRNLWGCVILGVLLFAAHKLRSVYAIYALIAMVLTGGFFLLRSRDTVLVRRIAFVILGFALCEMPWRMAMDRRIADPRILEKNALPTHAMYEPLISGIGWTENPWGIKPYDPWVAAFLAERTGGEPVGIAGIESERRSRVVYFGLVRERPLALLWLYARRGPTALASYSIFGGWGAIGWITATAAAIPLALKRRDAEGALVVLGSVAIAICLLLQIIVIDTRFIYAYPFEFVSAVVLSTAVAVVVRNLRPQPGLDLASDPTPRPRVA